MPRSRTPPQKFEFEAPRSLTDIVASRVRQAIVDGEFQLGQSISEESLADSFGVSRTPVRDALSLLQSDGLVEIRPKRGSFVFLPSEDDIRAICDFRATLELHAAKLSHAAARGETLARLRQLLDEMAGADARDDSRSYGRADTAFHEALFERCGNSYVRDAYQRIAGKIASMRTNLSKQFGDARAVSMDEHRELVRLFERGDFDAMEQLLQGHIGRTVEAFRRAASANPDLGAARAARRAAAPVDRAAEPAATAPDPNSG